MLRIRLLRVGKKNSPSFRVVVTPRRTAAKTGKFLEIMGFYNPIKHEKGLKIERIQYWLSQGAQPSDRVRNMLISEGIIEGEKVAVHSLPKAKPETPSEPEAKAIEVQEKPKEEDKKEEVQEEKMPEAEAPAEETEKQEETTEKPLTNE